MHQHRREVLTQPGDFEEMPGDPEAQERPLHADWILTISDDSGPPPYHIRDQEAHYAKLPPLSAAPADREALTPVRLVGAPATVWLPELEVALPMETPGPECQGWEWPSGATVLLLIVVKEERLPGLWALSTVRKDAWHVRVAGRLMRVRKVAHEDPGIGFSAVVEGYLDEHTSFFAQANAPSTEERDALLAAVLTLEWTSTAGSDAARSDR